jgi:hypothetical protein
MSFARTIAIAVAALVFWCGPAGAAGPLRPFKRGLWSGGAYTDDRSGAFTHCSAGVAYESGINLFVLLTEDYRWWLGFINPKWSLTPNLKKPIRLRLDDSAPFDRLATIPSRQLVLVPLPDSSRLLDTFRRSSTLALDAEGQSFSFKLNDTMAVIDRLVGCVRTSIALDARARTTAASTTAPVASDMRIGTAAAAGQHPVSAPPISSPKDSLASPPATAAADRGAADFSQVQTSPGDAPTTPTAATGPSPETISANSPTPKKSAPDGAAGLLSPGIASGAEAPSPKPAAGLRASAPQVTAPSPGSPEKTALPSQGPATARSATDGSLDQSRTSAPATISMPPATQEETAVSKLSPAALPPLAFTSVGAVSAPPPAAARAQALPEPTTPTAIEEVRLARDFFTKAGLPDARLVVAGKPSALAGFAAVWRSQDAAGAVKIIPPGPDVSAVDIASNLISVDPKVCGGDFAAARSRVNADNGVVISAVLSCSEADERRITEYFITPRQQGGFIVFAVIRSAGVGEGAEFARHKMDVLSKAAIQAAQGQG